MVKKDIEETLRIEPKRASVGKRHGYLDLRAFQGRDIPECDKDGLDPAPEAVWVGLSPETRREA